MSLEFTLVVFPLGRQSDWGWISGENARSLSASGQEPATHRWFSIVPTESEDDDIASTMSGDDTRLTVNLDIESPQTAIEAATGLKAIEPGED